MAKIKTKDEIEALRESGRRLGRILQAVKAEIKAGVTTRYLDEVAERLIREGGDTPPFECIDFIIINEINRVSPYCTSY